MFAFPGINTPPEIYQPISAPRALRRLSRPGLDPVSVAVDELGNTYVLSDVTIQKFAESGELVLEWGAPGSGDGEFGTIEGDPGTFGPFDLSMVAAPSGDVYVADTFNHRVQRFSAGGDFLGKWGTPGSGNGQFNTPTGIAVSPRTGDVYVVDSGNHRVQRFGATGNFLGAFGTEGSGDGQFGVVFRIAIDPGSGELLVPEDDPGRVQRFSPDGTFVSSFDAGQLGTSGIDVDLGGRIFLSDPLAHRISAFSRRGDFLGRFGVLGSEAGRAGRAARRGGRANGAHRDR